MIDKLHEWQSRLKKFFLGRALNPFDSTIFHHVSLVAFFAWVGLGSDGLSSSVYGPAEAYTVLHQYPYLALFVGLASVITIFIIGASYTQIIEQFPNGGGGYVVASKLLSPTVGMISGCALLIDYVLTITISVASGADAIFSFIPASFIHFKLIFALFGVFVLIIMNLRGTKESVAPLIPIFMIFLLTHAFIIVYAIFGHLNNIPETIHATQTDMHSAISQLGLFGFLFLVLKGYSMGAGTYTGIEAISNGVGILREPKVQTAKKTMTYMILSLSFMVLGLMLAYIFFHVTPQFGKTMNAVLLDNITQLWPQWASSSFIFITLFSEAAILFVAAQTGFLDGPRVLSNMALDRWFPSKFALLSDRLVTQKGVLIMGIAALITMALTQGNVTFLIVLYSINVFITFVLSQLGMVKFWWIKRAQFSTWKRKFLLNFVALITTLSILISMVLLKFNEGGWITLVVTGALILLMAFIKRHYLKTAHMLRKLDKIMSHIHSRLPDIEKTECSTQDKTAVLFVNGFTGLGLHTLASIHDMFPKHFKNFLFIQIGLIDAGTFKGQDEIEKLKKRSAMEIHKYVELMQSHGYYAEGISIASIDIVAEISKLTPELLQRFPNSIFFGGQLVLPEDSILTRWLHNSVVFAVQQKLYLQGIPFIILPVRV